MADSPEVILRRPCLFCRTIQYYRDGDDLQVCKYCGGEKFGAGTPALKGPRGYELTEEDRVFLRCQRINTQED